MRTIIQNGTVVTESAVFAADVLVENGVIQAVGKNLDARGAQCIDAAGKYVLPGGVDVNTLL